MNIFLEALKISGPRALFSTVYGITYGRGAEYTAVLKEFARVEPENILDVGGEGSIFPFILAKNYPKTKVSICDLREMPFAKEHLIFSNLRLLEKKNFVKVKQKFDFIYSISVLEHVEDMREHKEFVKNLHRCLTHGGEAVITVPVTKHKPKKYYRTADNYRKKSLGKKIFYLRTYNENTILNEILKQSGLKLVSLKYYGETGFSWMKKFWLNEKLGYLRIIGHSLNFVWEKLFINEAPLSKLEHENLMDFVVIVLKND